MAGQRWGRTLPHSQTLTQAYKYNNTYTDTNAFYRSLPLSQLPQNGLQACRAQHAQNWILEVMKNAINTQKTWTGQPHQSIKPLFNQEKHIEIYNLFYKSMYPKHKLLHCVRQKIHFLRDQQHRCILFWGKLQYIHTGLLSQMLCNTSEPLFTAFDPPTLSDDKNFLFFTQLSATYSLCLHEVILSGFKHLTAVGVA